jgi:hypothetical protein
VRITKRGSQDKMSIKYEPFHSKVLYKTPKYNDYFKENFKFFAVLDFIADLTPQKPPQNKQYIRRHEIYSFNFTRHLLPI